MGLVSQTTYDAGAGTVVIVVNRDGTSVSAGGGSTVRPPLIVDLANDGTAHSPSDRLGNATNGEILTGVLVAQGGQGIITSIEAFDTDDQAQTLEVYLFNEAPTLPADNAIWTLADSELLKLACEPQRLTSGYDQTNNYYLSTGPISVQFDLSAVDADKRLWFAVKTLGGGTWTDGRPRFKIRYQEVAVA